MDPIVNSKDDKSVQQYPMLAGFERITVSKEQGENVIDRFPDKELKESDLDSRSFEDVSNKNASTLKQHDATLKRWSDNVETAQAMCEERLDQCGNAALNRAIKSDGTITFDSDKNVFWYNNNGKTAKFKVIQGSNGKHLLQVTIVGRLSKKELESRIEEIVDTLGKCCGEEIQEYDDGKRTLKLGDAEIILPSKMRGKPRANFKVEHNKIHFQGDSYKNDMTSVFGKDNIPVNVNEGFSVKEISNEVWRNDCMRQVKSMISPMVELNEQYGTFLNNKNIKAPVNCLFELLSMNMMLNSVLGSQSKQHEEILKIVGSLSLAIEQGAGAVSIVDSVDTEYKEDSFESWKTTLENIHVAYDKFTKDIENLTRKNKTSTTFIAEEAILRQHEALLRELFVEAANRASDVLKIDKNEIANTISPLRSDMEFSSASDIMSNVIKMFVQQHNDKLELEKKEQERKVQEKERQQEIADLREDVRRFNELLEVRDAQIKELMQQIEAEKEESNQQIEDLKGQIGDLQSVIGEQNREVGELKDTIQQQTAKIDELNRTIDQRAKEFDQKISGLEEKIQELNQILQSRNAKIDELTKNIEELEAQIKELQEKSVQPLDGGDSNATMFNPVNSMGSMGVYGMQSVDDDMKREMEELKKLCEEQKRQLEEQQEEIGLLKNELERMQVDRNELDRLRNERDASMSRLDNFEKFLDEDDKRAEMIEKEDEERRLRSKRDEEIVESALNMTNSLLDKLGFNLKQ